ncbi:hypothetical protein CSB07_01805 [Candidatus Gracilibacteria bacterium]|nr:MAG: hypothetical protein CSB07_01805 [Candidatus Gracilibacteria bacterium]PIE85205.1 MAG: hypothetical protein CSA08_03015 [Candidatus Gracilibacteria bacterium]
MTKNKQEKDIVIPENIQNEINNKGFYLYRWITSDEIKMSIERDYLKIIKYTGPLLAIFSIFIGIIFGSIYFFLITVLSGIFLIILYLIGISIYRSYILVNNSYVVVSDSSVYVGGKSFNLNDTNKINSETKYISDVFEEKLFGNSWLSISKEKFYKDVVDGLFSGFHKVSTFYESKTKNSLPLILLYLLYVFILSISYFFGVFFLWIFTLLLSFINKIALRIVGNKAIIIDNLFIKIDKSSSKLSKLKDDIYKLLENAIDNEWKDGLLDKINASLSSINEEVDYSIDNSENLRTQIENSKYRDIINFSIYNSWLRKQIKDPLVQIKKLLIVSTGSLNKSKEDISKKLKTIKRKSLISNLELQLERIEIQLKNINEKIKSLDLYIKKL